MGESTVPSSTCRVRTQQGLVLGCDGPVRVFRGIPYAAPPLGERRWRAPAAPAQRAAPLECLEFGDDFPQAANGLFQASARSEDCLYLNIWTPAGARPGELPVMVWLHGGGFVSGSGSDVRCDGAAFAARGAVVVTLNYRSGIFGFFAHPKLALESERASAGNYGLLDQIAALHWVRENIAEFGGSPDRVSVFGVSAGSASIALLLVSPLARGLFQRAMLHSPGTCRPLGTQADAEALGRTLGDDLQALRSLNAADIFARTALLVPKMRGLTTPRLLRPIRDGWVIPDDELPLFDRGEFSAMPVLIGTNADEGSKLTATWTVDTLGAYRELLAGSFGSSADTAAQLYPASGDTEVRSRVAELFADTQFNYGAWRVARAMADAGQPTYRYLFTRRRPGLADGPHHGEEVSYVFDTLALQRERGGFAFDATDQRVARAMNEAWFNFARSGDPNAAVTGSDHPNAPATGSGNPNGSRSGTRNPTSSRVQYWPRFDAHQPRVRVFDEPAGEVHAWRDEQIAFLDQFAHAPR